MTAIIEQAVMAALHPQQVAVVVDLTPNSSGWGEVVIRVKCLDGKMPRLPRSVLEAYVCRYCVTLLATVRADYDPWPVPLDQRFIGWSVGWV